MIEGPITQLDTPGEATADESSILIIDDDQDQVNVLAHRLEKQGFQTLTADCGSHGLSLARNYLPDLILLDLRLPDVSGFDICTELADDPTTSAIPVIILSGMERPDIVRQSREAGCSYYVRKPYDPNALLILIKQSIQEASEWS